ncbi:MAG TPA: ATPase domain-containing protein [Longimicrobiales bacterium]|nr:ATPase domain-containing protein [Longimicrobiales bacterium]
MPIGSNDKLACTGVPGLDEILNGGLPRNHLYLVDGDPGTGKTTLGLQFLLDGVKHGEKGLYVTLSETLEELRGVATSHGWSLDDIGVFELPSDAVSSEAYTIFHPAEIELQRTVESVIKSVEELKPTRVVLDSLSEMRLLARDALKFRRQILALKQYFAGRNCTVIMLDDKTSPEGDLQLHSLAHGVIILEHISLDYGAERRRLQVTKLRGGRFRGGYHDFRILTGGMAVYPRILSDKIRKNGHSDVVTSDSHALDELLGGGATRGTSILITGAAGTGKSILASQYAKAAVERGEKVHYYMFDERIATFITRNTALGIDVSAAVEDGRIKLQQIEPTEVSPGEFSNMVMQAVEKENAKIIVLDSLNGYMQSMPEERLLPIQVHELLTYLANNDVTIIMTLVQRGVFGSPVDEAAEVSYLADTVILMRYFEFEGSVRQAISVVKKRSGQHERTIREAKVGKGGLAIGDPLREFHGVLTGVPTFTGKTAALFEQKPAADS